MDRRTFVKNAGLVTTWLGVSVVVQACSDEDDPAAPTGTNPGDVSGAVGTNHSHDVTITAAQISAGGAVTLAVTGGSHGHTIDLTAQQVGEIGAGNRVTTTTSQDSGHTHGVTFN
jgi:hypothetical protein